MDAHCSSIASPSTRLTNSAQSVATVEPSFVSETPTATEPSVSRVQKSYLDNEALVINGRIVMSAVYKLEPEFVNE